MATAFNLTGLHSEGLAQSVNLAVEQAGYSDQELADTRIPLDYSILDNKYNLDYLLQRLLELHKAAALKPDSVMTTTAAGVKLRIKKILSKLFRWYVVPMSDKQSNFNNETMMLINELVRHLKFQETLINRLQEKLCGEVDKESV